MVSPPPIPDLLRILLELLDEIATYRDHPTLLALSLACKSGTYVNLEAPTIAPIHLFLRTICERPNLAAKVRRVDIRGWRAEPEVAIGKRSKIFIAAAINSGLLAKPKEMWYTTPKDDGDFLRLLRHGVLRINGLSPYPLLDWHHFLSRSTTTLRTVRFLEMYGSDTTITEPLVLSGWRTSLSRDTALPANPSPLKNLSRFYCLNGAFELRLLGKILNGQLIRYLLYPPIYRHMNFVPGTDLSISNIAKLFNASKPTLGSLLLYPTQPPRGQTRLHEFEHLTTMQMGHPGLLNVTPEEVDPGPERASCVKIMLEQLVQLKVEGSLPAFDLVQLQFHNTVPSFTYGFPTHDPAVSVLGATACLPLPDAEAKVREELGELFAGADIQLEVCQHD
ncbi:hypothetical protein T440DRAFT_486005 [Plenodomus tracheiphilus IPT5]|uniref:Uncharacterized protein n=1 Tax=Plenodomus tracheiphilus IPT5 TaxID=1408161 RepID=A0A6A7BKL5_9PLEO|nr:hypothetical protein T440DRAFT_486005 [Plenodomus tracheiphilus IPT5]